MREILVIGSSNLDFIMQVDSLPGAGETVTDGAFTQAFGGKGANTAVAAARAAGRVTFITALGDDVYAPIMRRNFEADGICTDFIHTASGTACGSALVMVDRHGENYITVAPGANNELSPQFVEDAASLFESAGMVVMQMEIPSPTILRALEIARSRGVRTLFNYAPVRDRGVPISDLVEILVVNEHEAEALSGLAPEAAASALLARGPKVVIVTLGAAGALVASGEFSGHVPAFPVAAVDTTAAGDTFCGALAVALVEGRAIREAVRFANAASGLSVTRAGAQASVPHRTEIDALLLRRPS